MWWQSYRVDSAGGRRASAYVARRHARYTAVSLRGAVTLYGPPETGRTPATARPPPAWPGPNGYHEDPVRRCGLVVAPPGTTAAALAGRIRNEQVVWEVERPARSFEDLKLGPRYSPRGGPGTATQTFAPADPVGFFDLTPGPNSYRPFTAGEAAPALLDALEDPDQWVAAHVLLDKLTRDDRYRRSVGTGAGAGWFESLSGSGPDFRQTVDGLDVRLESYGPTRYFTYSPSYGDDFDVQACRPTIDPAQQPAIRDQWHRRLDVPVGSVRHWRLCAATAIPPMLWLTAAGRRALRRRRRRAAGMCRACGYDLRATPREGGALLGRCPECGAVASAGKGAA